MAHKIVDKMPGKHGQKIDGGLSVWHLNTDQFKDAIHYRLQVEPLDPSGITFHCETGEDFARHILAEEKRRDRKGEWNWIQVSKNNHLLDCLVIALAMGDPACWGGAYILQKPEAFPAKQQEQKQVLQKKYKEPLSKNNWFGDYGKNLFR
jgi:phage terminase large subunit GpA-like protein